MSPRVRLWITVAAGVAILAVLLAVRRIDAQSGSPGQPGPGALKTRPRPADVSISVTREQGGDFNYSVVCSYPDPETPRVKDLHLRAPWGTKFDGVPVEGWEGPPGWDSRVSDHGRVMTFRAVGSRTPGLAEGQPTNFRIRPLDPGREPHEGGRWVATTNGGDSWPSGDLKKLPYVCDWGSGDPDHPFPVPAASIVWSIQDSLVVLDVNDELAVEVTYDGAEPAGRAFDAMVFRPYEDRGDEDLFSDIDEVLDGAEVCRDGIGSAPPFGHLDEEGGTSIRLTALRAGLYYLVIGVDGDGDGVVDTASSSVDALRFQPIRVP